MILFSWNCLLKTLSQLFKNTLDGSEEFGDVFLGGGDVSILQTDFSLVVENRNPFEPRQNDRDQSAWTANLKNAT